MAYTTEDLGRLIARAHYQAWRIDAPPFDLTVEELAAILPNLIRSGSAGIVWHRVKPVRERYGALALALEAATDAQIAHNQDVEEAVVECVTRLRAYGIEPVLVKGLALAKLYPQGIVRPAGDIDLVVRKEEFAAAHAILRDSTRDPIPIAIDLKHPGIWEEVPNLDFWDRLTLRPAMGCAVQMLGTSDNLWMNCFHYLKHGGRRPLWLSDIALLGESLATSPFATSRRAADSWLNHLLGVSSQIIGANPRWIHPERRFPQWLETSMTHQLAIVLEPEATVSQEIFSNPLGVGGTFRRRWPDPLTAHWRISSDMSEELPVPVQFRAYLWQIRDFATHRAISQGYAQLRSRRNQVDTQV